MGIRYYLSLPCAQCGTTNLDVYYSESSGIESFACVSCGKRNLVDMSFSSRLEEEEVKQQESTTE